MVEALMRKTIITVLGLLFIFYQGGNGFGVGYRTDEPGTTLVIFPDSQEISMEDADAEVITVMQSNGCTYTINFTEYEAMYLNDAEPDLGIMTVEELQELYER
jgi:hypothetical protein